MTLWLESMVSIPKWYLIPFLIGLLFLFYWKLLKPSRCNIPSVSIMPFLRSLLHVIFLQHRRINFSDNSRQVVEGLCHLYREERMFRFSLGKHDLIICFGVKESEYILRSSSAQTKEFFYKLLEPWLGNGLLLSEGEKWQRRRKILAPAFNAQMLKDFLLIFNKYAKITVEKMKEVDMNCVNISKLMLHFSFSSITETTLGVCLDAQGGKRDEYIRAANTISLDLMKSVTFPLYWIKPLYNLSSVGKRVRKNIKLCRDTTIEIIQKRKAEIEKDINKISGDFQNGRTDLKTKKWKAFLDLLLHHYFTDKDFSIEDVRQEVDNFIPAGYVSASVTIAWTLYLIGWHEEIQQKVYEELRHIFGKERDRTVTIEDLARMKYMECVIKETQRLYPVIPIIGRRTSGDITTGGYFIPTNSTVIIPIHAIHRDATIYPNPEIFDPDRFLPENASNIPACGYIPFGAGLRNCIGQHFAMMEIKTILAYVLRMFKVRSLKHRDKLVFAVDFFLYANKPLFFALEKRLDDDS